jgi:hypothetical protein
MFCAVCVFGFLAVAAPAGAQIATSTFPADEAGIAAYVKLASIGGDEIESAKRGFFDSVESYGDHYVIGVKEYADSGKTKFHIYIGADGWLAAYLLKDQESSRIVNWNGVVLPGDTMLEVAIKDMMQKIGVGAAAGQTIKYYDFAHPEAVKMMLVQDFIHTDERDASTTAPVLTDDFSVTSKGTLYQFSWAIRAANSPCQYNGYGNSLSLDGARDPFGGDGCKVLNYGNYANAGLFNDHKSHIIKITKFNHSVDAAVAAVFIYGVI